MMGEQTDDLTSENVMCSEGFETKLKPKSVTCCQMRLVQTQDAQNLLTLFN